MAKILVAEDLRVSLRSRKATDGWISVEIHEISESAEKVLMLNICINPRDFLRLLPFPQVLLTSNL
jgi:hypothetical protein